MFSTDQFRVFSGAPVDRLLSRPRRLLQEGRVDDSETAYQAILATNPDLKQAWLEYFALLRFAHRHQDALWLGDQAAAHFGDDALPAALRGAALVELGRFREGLEALDHAARCDPDLGLVWHEAGYAAFRLGELSRALMALDRAFALEPHGGTLHLRGRVLRQAGRYLAAEVAFEGAAQAAEFPAQRQAAEREIRVTRRYAAFPGTRPETLPPVRRWFADTGATLLSGGDGPAAGDAELTEAFVQLAQDAEWRFGVVVALDPWDGWYGLSSRLDLPVAAEYPSDPHAVPLVVSRTAAPPADRAALLALPAQRGRGLSLVLDQALSAPAADVTGRLAGGAGPVDPGFAIETALHPEALLHDRILR